VQFVTISARRELLHHQGQRQRALRASCKEAQKVDDEKLLATVRTLVRKLADAGATPEVIAFAVEAMETAVEAARAIGQRYQASPVPQ
jgi:hypothetical protein